MSVIAFLSKHLTFFRKIGYSFLNVLCIRNYSKILISSCLFVFVLDLFSIFAAGSWIWDMKILIVDDEPDICEILQYNLETEGFEVCCVNSAEEALEMRLKDFSLILLDVMMGEVSGYQMARILKDNMATAHIPVIFITALDGEDDIVKGLNIGADDYIAKPLSMKEVKARVKAVLRRSANTLNTSEDAVGSMIVYQGIILDLNAKTATCDGVCLEFTKLEFELLSFFLRHGNKVFSREDLLRNCWPKDVTVLDRTVDVNITRLRKKIGHYGKQLKTRVGYGYYFEK